MVQLITMHERFIEEVTNILCELGCTSRGRELPLFNSIQLNFQKMTKKIKYMNVCLTYIYTYVLQSNLDHDPTPLSPKTRK
jgi:hypothetical protein